VTIFRASPAPHMMTIIKKTLHTGIAHAMYYACM
jgi:threonine/homoserine/homoserine lactone efflux protein